MDFMKLMMIDNSLNLVRKTESFKLKFIIKYIL